MSQHTKNFARAMMLVCSICACSVGFGSIALAAQSTPTRSLIAAWRFDGNGTTDSFVYFDSSDGRGYLVDRLRRDPLQLRRRLLPENLFGAIGRPGDQPALPGELQLVPLISSGGTVRSALLVETSSGYLAYFDEFARNQKLGEMSTTLGRPFSRLSAVDGAFALLPRRGRGGRTEAVYLYHAPTGRCLMVTGVESLTAEPGVVQVTDLPTMSRVEAVTLERNRTTTGFLLIDQGAGRTFFIDIDPAAPSKPTVRRSPLDLTRLFPGSLDDPPGQRFLPVALQGGGDTLSVLVVHAPTGALGLIDGLRDDQPPSFVPIDANLSSVLASGTEPRQLTAVPREIAGSTQGVWLLDGTSGSLALVDRPLRPVESTIGRVRFETN